MLLTTCCDHGGLCFSFWTNASRSQEVERKKEQEKGKDVFSCYFDYSISTQIQPENAEYSWELTRRNEISIFIHWSQLEFSLTSHHVLQDNRSLKNGMSSWCSSDPEDVQERRRVLMLFFVFSVVCMGTSAKESMSVPCLLTIFTARQFISTSKEGGYQVLRILSFRVWKISRQDSHSNPFSCLDSRIFRVVKRALKF